ncbi:MAG: glutamate synthase [bacterium]|nr:glutamate synthase [bacterium]
MTELRPCPFGVLVTRMFGELEAKRSIFDLPERRFFLGDAERDLSVSFHGHTAATPLGPAAGPQSQMAQNLVLSWLGGCRIHELKTVQIDDELVIPRPCIDMQTVGYNVEWSQELKLEQSLEEYVKGSMLIELLVASGELELAPDFERTLFDMSVGYGLEGIQSERVQAFVRGMLDCTEVVDRLRGEIPPAFAHLAGIDFTTRLSDTLTLSTFHGCPADEIERIVHFLLHENRLNCIIKLNPMLLGPARTRELLHDTLGYDDVRVPDSAFEKDTSWERMSGFVERLGEQARALELGLGVKFTNTLVVENHRDFFPADEREMYLSGPPLHVLAMNLVRAFRAEFGDRYPISFSAGIDRKNFADAVAIGLVPVTVCSDLLKPGGYARAHGYFEELTRRMDARGARCVDDFIVSAYGVGAAALARLDLPTDEHAACERALASEAPLADAVSAGTLARWVSEAALANTTTYVEAATRDPRYRRDSHTRVPRKIGSELELFDCITCDKCVPVCPNDANFSLAVALGEISIVKAHPGPEGWTIRVEGALAVDKPRQYANFADFCNDCGNCDVFCPEDGGPYLVKPRFFGTRDDWSAQAHLDGFFVARDRIEGRIDGATYGLVRGSPAVFTGNGFRVSLVEDDPTGTLDGEALGEVDLTVFEILRRIHDAVLGDATSYPALASAQRE